MGSSDQAISHQNLHTSSAIRTETITGSHMFKIYGYSLIKGIGIRKSIDSDIFTVGGYNWRIKICPDGFAKDFQDFISISLQLENEGPNAKARISIAILQPNGERSKFSTASKVACIWPSKGENLGHALFVKRSEFEASEYLKDDAFTVKCVVTVIKGTKLEATNNYGVIVPPSNLNQNWANLLEGGKGADVTFVVNGERIKAHRCVLAERSVVFNAELFGCMKEKLTDTITVEDIEAPVFKSMLYFIYSDSVPNFEETSEDECEKKDLMLMAAHLLVAADRYQLERLRLICEDLLCKNLCVNNTAATLILAERHNCSQLKAECLKFISIPEVFKAVAQTYEFHNLLKICPSILKNI